MDGILNFVTSAARLIVAVGLAYVAALWFALIVWTYRDIETRSRSVVTQIFATLLVVLFFVPGAILYYVLRPRETLDESFQRSLEEEYLLQDLEDLPRCHKCHRGIESDWIVCPSCHTELRHECPNCAHLVRVTWDICPYCATELEPASAREDANSSIGRLTAMIRDRFGEHINSEGKPVEPGYPAALPLPQGPGIQPPVYAQPIPLPQYTPQQQQQIAMYNANGNGGSGSNGGNGGANGSVPVMPVVPFSSPASSPTQATPVGQEAHPNGFSTAPRTSSDPYNNADVPLDFESLPPVHVEAPHGNGNGNGNGVAANNGAGNGLASNGGNGRTNGHYANGPAPNGHIAAANGSNGFHPNGNGRSSSNPLDATGGGSGVPGFGPMPQPVPPRELGPRVGESVGPPAAPMRRP